MSERTIENVRQYNLDPKEVIKGLNGYYESDKCNSYITVRRNDVEGPVYFTAALYLSALIEWLRVDHDIFYRPGLIFDQVEAARNAAKMCCLRAHIKDEIGKRGIWCDKDVDISELVDTLFKAYDECSKARDRNREDATKLSEVTQELRKELKGIMDYIRQEASRNGFDLPEEIDGGPLTVKRVFHDLLELLGKKEAQRKAVNEQRWEDLRDIYKALGCDDAYSNVDDFAKAVKSRAEYIESLSRIAKQEADNSDRYISDRIRSSCKAHGVVIDAALLTTSDWSLLVTFLCYEVEKLKKEVEDVKKETKRECYWYLWGALKKLSPECDALKIDCYEDLVDRIFYEMSLATENCKQCQRKHSTEKLGYIQRANKAEEEVKELKDVIKRLKELLNEINKEEDE